MEQKDYLKDVLLIISIILLVTGVFYLNNNENPAMHGLTPHPYFVISILIAAFYGFKQSVFTSCFSGSLYLLLLHFQLDYEDVETILDFEFLIMPISMIFLSMLVGELKQRTLRDLEDANKGVVEKEKLIESQKREVSLLEQQLSEMKQRLVSKLETMEEIYDIGLSLFKNNIDELFPNFMMILNQHLDVEGASIYIKVKNSDRGGDFRLAKGFPFTDEFEDEVNAYTTRDMLFRKAVKDRKMVTIKDVSTKDEFESWDKQTVISVPVVVGGEIHAILNIHNIPFLKYTPTTFKKINLLVKWLGQSLQYAMNYEGYSRYSVLDETYHIYKNDYFYERLNEEIDVVKKYGSSFSVMKVKIFDFSQVSEVKKVPYKKLISNICLKGTRRKDCVAEGKGDNELFIIVSNIDEKETHSLKQRISEELEKFKFYNESHERIKTEIKHLKVDDASLRVESIIEGLQ